jgi:hypothetical protein
VLRFSSPINAICAFRRASSAAAPVKPSSSRADAAAADCWAEADALEALWQDRLAARPRPRRSALGRSGALAWARLNTAAGLPSSPSDRR